MSSNTFIHVYDGENVELPNGSLVRFVLTMPHDMVSVVECSVTPLGNELEVRALEGGIVAAPESGNVIRVWSTRGFSSDTLPDRG